MERPWSMATLSSLLWNSKTNAIIWIAGIRALPSLKERCFRWAKGDYVGGDSCLWPVLCGGGAATLFIVAVVKIDKHEIHEQTKDRREV